ncbi:MAG: DNA recombination protein RecF [Ignavibacteria bacterium GWB2_35_6b]|nr:MAG: DNA recombination protein RecF [Ignavibacteria bacterium GWB2_35_6b]
MILNTIEIINFRLHTKTVIKFSEDLNYIIGGNGQGKTTILEAIYYLCTTKNLNQSPDSEALTFNESYFELAGKFKDLTEDKNKLVFFAETNKKNYIVNDKQVYRASSIIGKFPVVTLTQSDHSITFGSPADRRKFIDSVISQSSETYLKILLEYNKTLRQRSSLLSLLKETKEKSFFDELDAWTETLILTGTEIVKHRIKFVKEFENYVKDSYQKIMEGNEAPEINYNFLGETDLEKVDETFRKEINNRRSDELIRAANLVGPHRDDFIFKINNFELRKFGSQGQHKTFQIALRFGEFFYLKDVLGKTPIFLMDDIFGELDTYRSQKISGYLREVGQAFITMTDFNNIESLAISEKDKIIKVEKGAVVYA